MKKVYVKPELIDLNEQTGIGKGSECRNGSGDKGDCYSGNVAGAYCEVGSVGMTLG